MSHIVIVGAGPAGASLAHLLSSRGINVTLLERRRDFSREFRGEILMPSGIAAIQQMGLSRPMAAVPTHRLRSLDVFMNAKRVFGLDASLLDDIPIQAVSQPAFLEMIVEQANASGRFRFERGASPKALIVEKGRIVGLAAKLEAAETELRADLVIGADGRNSAVRKLLGLKLAHVSPPMDVVWCKLACPDDWDGVRAYAGKGHLLVAYRTWDAMLQLGWIILKGTFGDLRSRGDQWLDEMADHVSHDLAGHLRAHRSSIERPFLLDVVSDCVETWTAPGSFVIGDAAHAMSPVGGQGINIALRDAVVAANHLVPVLTRATVDPNAVDHAIANIETERMREVAPIQAMQAQPPKLVLSRSWWGEPTRRVAAKLLGSPRVRARAGARVAAFPFGLTEVNLKV